jgi:TPR repeat protein
VIVLLARRGLLATAFALLLAPCAARAAESPSYTAYFQGRYLTALKLAEQEAAQGSKEAFTLMGEIYEQGRRSRRRQCAILARRVGRRGAWREEGPPHRR